MRWTRMLCVSLLASGCASGSYCDITTTMHFSSEAIIDWLIENDEPLLRDIVNHNETRSRLCLGSLT
jgi:hypothetical protein